jgi:predicted RNA binding protein YcfA (HicA-like mRNA interferase family)
MAPKHRGLSGKEIVKVLCKNFGFSVSGQKGSHVRLSKLTPEG